MNLRARLLAALAEPLTAKGAAQRLAVPVGRLYHHLDRLLAEGRIGVVAEHRRRAVLERTFQALGPLAPGAVLEAMLSEGTVAAVATTRLRLTPERLRVLEARLGDLLAALESPDGSPVDVLLVAVRPAPPAG